MCLASHLATFIKKYSVKRGAEQLLEMFVLLAFSSAIVQLLFGREQCMWMIFSKNL